MSSLDAEWLLFNFCQVLNLYLLIIKFLISLSQSLLLWDYCGIYRIATKRTAAIGFHCLSRSYGSGLG